MKKDNKSIIILVALIIIILVVQIVIKQVQNNTYNKIFNDTSTFEKKVYKENEFNSVRMELSDMLNAYLSDFVQLCKSDINAAYSKLTYRDKKDYKDIKDLKKILKEKKIDSNIKIKEFSEKDKYGEYYLVLTTNDNEIRIYEEGIWNYKIQFIN